MSTPNISDIRKAVIRLKEINARQKSVKYYKCEVKNNELFDAYKKAGRLKETRPGSNCWDLVE